jgi:hypothetical protein
LHQEVNTILKANVRQPFEQQTITAAAKLSKKGTGNKMIILTVVLHGESTGTLFSFSKSWRETWSADTMLFLVSQTNLKLIWAGNLDAPLSSHGAS